MSDSDNLSNAERAKEIDDPELSAYYLEIKTDRGEITTADQYRETFLLLEDWMESKGIDEWNELQPAHLTQLQGHLLNERGLYDMSAERHFDRLRRFFGEQNRDDLVERIDRFSTTSQTLYQQKTGEEVLYLDIYEYNEILEATETLREKLIIQSLWETGMRRSELSEMTLQRVDTDERIFKVNNKKNEGVRTIPYSAELQPTIVEWMEYGGRSQYSKAENSEYLLVSQHSKQVQPSYINDVVRRVADRTDVSYSYAEDAKGRKQWFPTAHHFRNSYATHRVSNGMSLEKLRELMGHSDVEQTSRYVGVKDEDLRDANEKYRPKTRSPTDDFLDQI